MQILVVFLNVFLWFIQNHQASPRSTPNSSPRSTKSPPLPPGAPSSRSAPPTPGGQLQPSMMASLGTGADSLTGVGGDVRSAFGTSSSLIGELLYLITCACFMFPKRGIQKWHLIVKNEIINYLKFLSCKLWHPIVSKFVFMSYWIQTDIQIFVIFLTDQVGSPRKCQ